ncbi:MAG: D-alanyl-D-alanine carboxypeptidase [Clostridiales bacterium]|nr:D-alanyl-D-alanine carboxypeptidase [Clostridiales bacterium]
MSGKKGYIFLAGFLSVWLVLSPVWVSARTETAGEETAAEEDTALIEAPAGVLMEAETGTLLFSKDMDTRRSPASITKIMTLLLIFDELEKGNIRLTDTVTVSAYAKSMGGSQVYLEEGETQDVETMIKCIVIASGNDASVAMAEHLAGSEQEFVKRMNQRAQGLGMENTNFEGCCGLTDSENHYTTARDVAVMSRELITCYPEILTYSSIWMEDITHVTAQGSSNFTLTNTNKLLRSFEGCVGLKTGSTSIAKYCVSAVARRDGIILIAVVMAAPDYKVRFRDAAAMLNYGFARCSLYVDEEPEELPRIKIRRGVQEETGLEYASVFTCLNTDGQPFTEVERRLKLPESAQAPVQAGEKAGEMEYYMDGEKIGSVDILYSDSVEKAGYVYYLKKAAAEIF